MEKEKKYLFDILQSILLIEDFLVGVDSFEQYTQDKKTQSAIERQLSIIGEAVNKYQKLEPANPIKNFKSIVSFRNWLVHAYDSIDKNSVWNIVHNHLPNLKEEVKEKISQ